MNSPFLRVPRGKAMIIAPKAISFRPAKFHAFPTLSPK